MHFFDRLICRAQICIDVHGALGLFPCSGRDLKPVSQTDLGDSQDAVYIFDVPFHMGDQIFC